ncbi:EAL-associated domain-containing protein [Bacillus sp. 31A1R]|uniref:EAL-associated domain-containing protein n=1 Tax=Robertmurraya mangrovi TaxID=3098077 RepID=A0ABU5ITX7_9BACI|nr:EAL-associated domain-containing protein [Bacillus sp. 31A1R]MDZ5470598.1 EAL-associated domain-containing protein [Bacillus sp. 31A1R]
MDALDILTDLDNVVPFFQPIFSADEHRVIGYEILGRYRKTEGEYISLGPFFHDDSIPEEYRLEVDNTVLRKALNLCLSLEKDELIFVNRDADLLMHGDGEIFLELLQDFQEKGIQISRIVLEISERNYKGDIGQLDNLLNYYRTYGLKIAIDKMGNDSSHLDRIARLEPNLLKIDLMSMRSNNNAAALQDILYSISMLARKLGATLLFENIEMEYQLQFAWKNGGRYYQGYYLQVPQPEFVHRDVQKNYLKDKFHKFIAHEKKKLETVHKLTESFQIKLVDLLNKYKKYLNYEELLVCLGKDLDHAAFRMYICDEDGFQESANIFKSQEDWIIQPEYVDKNWSWRSYFLENIFKMRYEKKGILSDLYSDIETGETIRTFSYPLSSKHYLFIDLSYGFLYENDGLL